MPMKFADPVVKQIKASMLAADGAALFLLWRVLVDAEKRGDQDARHLLARLERAILRGTGPDAPAFDPSPEEVARADDDQP